MQLVEKHVINKSHPDWKECDQISFNSNTIRNQALYVQRQSWFYGHGVIKFGKVEEHRNIDALMKSYPCYQTLPAFLAQQVTKSLNAEWTGFFNGLREWKVEPTKFTGRPKPPNYKPRNGRYKVEYPNTRAYIGAKKDGIIHLYCTKIQIKTSHALNYDCVRIIPSTGCYVIEVVYSVEDVPFKENGFVAAMDLGVNNLGTVTSKIACLPTNSY